MSTTLAWSDALALNHPQMDATHVEFVDLLAACDAALPGSDAELLVHWDALVAHTEDHFAQEDRWMDATGFEPENCHSFQHHAVLQVMRECARQARDPAIADFEPLRVAIGELAIWFPQHAQSMDAALAQHLDSVGYDAATGTLREPALAGAAHDGTGHGAPRISGCGGSSCG
jgi:hemerythrin